MDGSDVTRAAEAIAPHLHRTPTIRSSSLSRQYRCDVFLKLELFQKTGSFKPRGAIYHLLRLDDAARARGVISISAGNHAAGLAFAARVVGTHATLVMPASASPTKATATREYGAEVILHGTVQQAFERVHELEVERRLTFVHPFDHADTVAGHGTVGLEMCADIPDVDVVVVPIGGGGLIAGVALAVKSIRPSIRVIGVEPEGAAAMDASRRRGERVTLEEIRTIADGLAPPFVGALNFELCEQYVDELVTVTDAQIIEAMRYLMTRVKVFPEPSGAATLAALQSGVVSVEPGARVACIVSGGNMDPNLLSEYLNVEAT